MLDVHQTTALTDNYCVLIHDSASKLTISIDAPDAAVIASAAAARGWTLTHVLVTHHHLDHTQGLGDLKRQFNVTVLGPAGEAHKIQALDQQVAEGFGLDVIQTRRGLVEQEDGRTSGQGTTELDAALSDAGAEDAEPPKDDLGEPDLGLCDDVDGDGFARGAGCAGRAAGPTSRPPATTTTSSIATRSGPTRSPARSRSTGRSTSTSACGRSKSVMGSSAR
jgi:hypothetical protein